MIKLVSALFAVSAGFMFALAGCSGVDSTEGETESVEEAEELVVDGPESDLQGVRCCGPKVNGVCPKKWQVPYPNPCP